MNPSQVKVPFSWENKPGICKETGQLQVFEEDCSLQKLPPPPCRSESGNISMHDIEIPLPPCVFQPPLRTSSGRSLKKTENDPFLAAYKECTKSTKKGKKDGSGLKRLFSFSCKRSCSVRDDNIVRVSQLPLDQRDTDLGIEMGNCCL
ncbi:uncharacterized protein LOC120138323 [Hibiscus syriacus]|uniref:uncharacterized protein LOC120138323 n=1 Tax=Hibiscus syriacus TaxID=106335 RepID=UPI0019215B6F|nr:uncharacterized protein LOC120138323 [Hibiscus syriacus]